MCQAKKSKKVFHLPFAGILTLVLMLFSSIKLVQADVPRLMVFGDSLVAGYGLPAEQGFTSQLQDRLSANGFRIEILNAGVSGDTSAGGAARLDWALSEQPDYVMIVLGGNDLLRGLDPGATRQNLDQIIARLAALNIKTFLCGMLAPLNLGPEYSREFNPIYPELAQKYDLAFYPFFLENVALVPALNQRDGLHPNADGVAKIIDGMMPVLSRFLAGEVK
ncbi:MAG: arylesterase [Candidatus Puniceispirillaceae bacterium]